MASARPGAQPGSPRGAPITHLPRVYLLTWQGIDSVGRQRITAVLDVAIRAASAVVDQAGASAVTVTDVEHCRIVYHFRASAARQR